MGLFGKSIIGKGTKSFFRSLVGGNSSKSDAKDILKGENVEKGEHPSIKLALQPNKPFAGESKPKAVAIRVVARPKSDVACLENCLFSLHIANISDLLTSAEQDDLLACALTSVARETVRLKEMAIIALGHRQNIERMAKYIFDIMVVIASNGQDIFPSDVLALNKLHSSIKEACELAVSCSQPGWLARMARADGMQVEFSRMSIASLNALKSTSFGSVPGTIRLTPPMYYDLGKSMKMLLKDLGCGSVYDGVARLQTDLAAQQETASLADVPVSIIAKEAELDPSIPGATQVILDGPVRNEECQRVFFQYVTTSPDGITADGFQRLMIDMGLLDTIDAEQRPAAARTAFVKADTDYDGALSFPEFRAFYGSFPITPVRLHVRLAAGLAMERKVQETFATFAAFGAPKNINIARTLDSTRFAKLCRDCGLLTGAMTPQHVDVVYTSAKPREARRMPFDHFLSAMFMIADKRGQPIDRVLNAVAHTGRPVLHATRAGFVKLHDDKGTFTGVCARGGPSIGPINLDLRFLVDRSKEPTLSPRPASGGIPEKVQPTRPESPVLATKDRVASPGPTTPGRGASLLAAEKLAASRAATLASPRSQASAFGRTSTPRVSELATPHRKGRKQSPNKGHPEIRVPTPQDATAWESMNTLGGDVQSSSVEKETSTNLKSSSVYEEHDEAINNKPFQENLDLNALSNLSSEYFAPAEDEGMQSAAFVEELIESGEEVSVSEEQKTGEVTDIEYEASDGIISVCEEVESSDTADPVDIVEGMLCCSNLA